MADVGRRLPNSCDEDVYFEWYSVSRMAVLRLAGGNHTLEHKMATDRCRESRPSSTVSEPASLLTTGPDEPCRECQGRKSGSRAGFRLDSRFRDPLEAKSLAGASQIEPLSATLHAVPARQRKVSIIGDSMTLRLWWGRSVAIEARTTQAPCRAL